MCQTPRKNPQAASTWYVLPGVDLCYIVCIVFPTRPDPISPTDSPTVAYLCLAFLWREWTREGKDAINPQNPCIYIHSIILIRYILLTKTIDIMDTNSIIKN